MKSIWIFALLMFVASPLVLAQTKAQISAKVTASSLETTLIARAYSKSEFEKKYLSTIIYQLSSIPSVSKNKNYGR